MKMKPMKLEGALKLYMVLYSLAFLFTFMMSVPMLKHVMPKSECLLFVQQSFTDKFVYGNPGGCMATGILPLVVALGALGLIFFQWLQLRKLNTHLANPKISSDEYRANTRTTFWRMIIVHCVVGGLVVIIAFLLTAGYVVTCRSIYLVVEKELRARILHTPNSNRAQQQIHENFASDNALLYYTGNNYNSLGQNRHLNSITCRSLLTDSQNHYTLKLNHKNNEFYAQYWNFWNNDNQFSDVGNFEQMTFTDNMTLEVCLAGAWISSVLWLVILVLVLKERHHMRAHLTEESMWGGGSEYGQGSVRSGRSRKTSQGLMSPVDFDVMSDNSRVSKASRSSKGTSYKDMGGSRNGKTRGSSSSYKNMAASSAKPAEQPSRLTVSRLEQVPSLPADYGVTKLLQGGLSSHEPPNDTSSVADMSMATVNGAIIGPCVGARHDGSMLDYFSHNSSVTPREEKPPQYRQMFTSESDIM